MSFSNKVLNQALNTVLNRKKAAENEYSEKTKALLNTNKKYKEVSEKLKQLGASLCISAFSGNNAESEKIKARLDALQQIKQNILAENNIGNSPTYSCPKCSDTGYFNNTLCDCVKLEARRMRMEEMSKEMPICNCDFDNFKLTYYSATPDESGFTPRKVAKKTLDICKDFCKTFPNGTNLFFCGGCGLGKTHLTLAIANEIICNGYDVIYGSAQNIISKISKEQLSYNSQNEYLESVLDCDLLILDDLGTEFSTNLSSSVVYNIINTRILKGLSTIISTNLTLKEIENTYSSRIVSRINGHYTMRMFIGNDIRQLKKQNS